MAMIQDGSPVSLPFFLPSCQMLMVMRGMCPAVCYAVKPAL